MKRTGLVVAGALCAFATFGGIMLHDDKLSRTARGIPKTLATNSVSKALT